MKKKCTSVDSTQGVPSTKRMKTLTFGDGLFVMTDTESEDATIQQIEIFEKLCRKGAFILIGADCVATADGVEASPIFFSNIRQSSEKLFFFKEALKFAVEDQEKFEYLDGIFNLLGPILEDA